jgi:hypothetical protein
MASHPCCVLVDDDPEFITFARVCLRRICPTLEFVASAIIGCEYSMRLMLIRQVRETNPDLPIATMPGDDPVANGLLRR